MIDPCVGEGLLIKCFRFSVQLVSDDVSVIDSSGGAGPGRTGSGSCRDRKSVFVGATRQDVQTGNRKSLK